MGLPAAVVIPLRSVLYDLSSPMATHAETALLRRKGVTNKGTMNLLVWRRSTLLLALAFTAAAAYFMFENVAVAEGQLEQIVNASKANITYSPAADGSSFRSYSARVATTAGASAMLQVAEVRYYAELTNAALGLLSLVGLLFSALFWSYYRRSRQFVMLSWLFSFIIPFGVSTIPTRCFVDWSQFGSQTFIFMKGVSVHYELEKRETEVVAGCTIMTDPANPQTLEEARANVEFVCGTVDDWDDGFVNWMSGGAIARAEENCRRAQEALNDGNVDLALFYADETCADVLDTVESAQDESGSTLRRLQVVMLHQDLVTKARVAAELGISLLNALWALKGMVPAAVAIAPALLRGALTIKTLVPQSSIPGMFVILLPWLYCPLVWCIYNVAFQLTGTLVFFFGLLLLAFAPMSYVLLGQVYGITRPMDDASNRRMMNGMAYLNMALLAAAAFLCSYFTFGQDGDHRALAKRGIDEFLSGPGAIFNLFVSTASKYLITTLAGVDFMTNEIAEQREFEKFLQTGNNEGNFNAKGLGSEGRFRLLHMQSQRDQRLDDLCFANRKQKGFCGFGGASGDDGGTVQRRTSTFGGGKKKYHGKSGKSSLPMQQVRGGVV